jgi:hypothetical protein
LEVGQARQYLPEEDGDTQIVHHRERWTNEVRLVYGDGRTMKLTETPTKSEESVAPLVDQVA